MTSKPEGPHEEAGFNAASWCVLAVAVIFTGFWLGQAIEQSALATDGWRTSAFFLTAQPESAEPVEPGPSPLQPGDRLVAIDGRPFSSMGARGLDFSFSPPPGWEPGRTIRYTVRRDGREVDVDVGLRGRSLSEVLGRTARILVGGLPGGDRLLLGPGSTAALPFMLIGIFVFLRRPRSPAARILFLLGVAWFVQVVTTAASLDSIGVYLATAHFPSRAVMNVLWILPVFPLLTHFSLVFPVVKWPMRRLPIPTLAVLYGLPPGLFLGSLLFGVDVATAFPRMQMGHVVLLMVVLLSAGHTLLTNRDAGQAQIRWVAWGTFVAFGAAFGLTRLRAEGVPVPAPLFGAAFTVFPVALAIAILRYRLFDIDVVINRTLVYALVTGALALVFNGAAAFLQWTFRSLVGEGQDVAIVLSTLAAAALFYPIRQRVQSLVDRRFYRRKYDAARVLAAFSATARDEVDLNKLTGQLVAVAEETMQPAHVSLWLREPRPEPETDASLLPQRFS